MGLFRDKITEALDDDYFEADYSPEDAELHLEDPRIADKQVLFNAPVKNPKRMAVKVADKRGSAKDPKKNWPHTQALGDCLRCSIECPDAESMLRAWCQIRRVFKMRHGRGRLKNRLLMNEIPPDMLLNGQFTAAGGFQMMAEIQIHLRAIHALKQQNHLYYEIQRANTINEIRPGGAPPVVPAGGEAAPPAPTDEGRSETLPTQEQLKARFDEVDADHSGRFDLFLLEHIPLVRFTSAAIRASRCNRPRGVPCADHYPHGQR